MRLLFYDNICKFRSGGTEDKTDIPIARFGLREGPQDLLSKSLKKYTET